MCMKSILIRPNTLSDNGQLTKKKKIRRRWKSNTAHIQLIYIYNGYRKRDENHKASYVAFTWSKFDTVIEHERTSYHKEKLDSSEYN